MRGKREEEQPRASSAQSSLISTDKNLMPSMVVRQQRSQLLTSAESFPSSRPASSSSNNNNQPQQQHQLNQVNQFSVSQARGELRGESPNTLELLHKTRVAAERSQQQPAGGGRSPTFDQNGLVLPRRVPHQHPQLMAPNDSETRQQANTIRDLNRELMFNQVRGKNVLEQKSELKRAMEKIEASRRKKEAEQERLTRRSSLELRLEERAERLARQSAAGELPSGPKPSESKSGVLS